MQFIHQGCLNKWLEVKRCKKAPVCELCNYQFHRHKKFRLHHWQLPSCSRADKVLHCIFLVCLLVMATCATITIVCFKQDRVPPEEGRRRAHQVRGRHLDLWRPVLRGVLCGNVR
ncbi:hypothetical protein O3P69_019367 [Scylla paramamosain]|uniref:RING-CH-type domain-containing protein n=1 Tax=Scylla paramamosain TaxID=85552 RepID=A0AAW0SWB6_SCYPA